MKIKLMATLVLGSFVLAGCGGGGGDTTTSMPGPAGSPLSLASLVNGHIVQPGTYHLVGAPAAFLAALGDVEVPADGYAPDSMITVGGISLRCTSDNSANCNITVHGDGSFTTMGTIATILAGGEFPMTVAERLIAAERARAEAEKARADAAESAQQQEQAAREQAEREAAEATARARAGSASKAIDGLRSFSADSPTTAGTVMVTPRHGALASVSTTPTVNFASKSLSSASGWSVTTQSNSGFTYNDELVVYSNRGPATRVLLTQEYGSGSGPEFVDNAPANAGTIMTVQIDPSRDGGNEGRRIRSGSFPATDGADKTFPFNVEGDDPPDTTDGHDKVRFSGTFHGAPGHFECETTTGCTIGRRGDRYVVVAGTWNFLAADTARAQVDDKSYVYFGWWKRVQKSNEEPTFQVFRGGASPSHVATVAATAFDALGPTATYRGPAIGQYSIYQPLGTQSDAGSFTASAELTADFTTNLLSGTVSGFSNNPDWSLTLNSASMAGGDVDDGAGATDWTIAGNTSRRQGAWDATFYSEAPYVGQVPDVVIGDFTGIYDADADSENGEVGRILGAFGARK